MKQILVFLGIISIGIIVACNTRSTVRSASQNYQQNSEGRYYLGKASSHDACGGLALGAGCKDSFVWYSNNGRCFCK